MDDTTRIEVDDSGIQNSIAILRGFGDDQLNDILQYTTDLMGTAAEQYAIIYPPQQPPRPPKPRFSKKTGKELKPRKVKAYVRTGRLGSSLTHSEPEMLEMLSWFTKIGTDVEYSPYVVGMPDDDPGQAWMHKGVWTPMETQIKVNLPAIRRVVEDELNRRIAAAFMA